MIIQSLELNFIILFIHNFFEFMIDDYYHQDMLPRLMNIIHVYE